MSTISETSLSLLSQSNSPSIATPWARLLIAVVVIAGALYYMSPTRLARVLFTALADLERTYLSGVENGVLTTDVDFAERITALQLKVSTLREASLRNSLSPFSAFFGMFNIRCSVTVLRCLAEVRELRTRIAISHEYQLREIAFESRCQCPLSNRDSISLRQRNPPRLYLALRATQPYH
ncbi:hypothetical protein C8R45DRAFT_1065826 [Mycena sanguinolenta]|nr:hypothetical protein C8R45DRAFT_1065826 [Mycena sanguinolenta]